MTWELVDRFRAVLPCSRSTWGRSDGSAVADWASSVAAARVMEASDLVFDIRGSLVHDMIHKGMQMSLIQSQTGNNDNKLTHY